MPSADELDSRYRRQLRRGWVRDLLTTGAPPGTTKDIGAVTTTSTTLEQHPPYYFNIRSVDVAGNCRDSTNRGGPSMFGARARRTSSSRLRRSPIALPARRVTGLQLGLGDGGCAGLRINGAHTGAVDFVSYSTAAAIR